jgi:iron complex outermembrane receptor protein
MSHTMCARLAAAVAFGLATIEGPMRVARRSVLFGLFALAAIPSSGFAQAQVPNLSQASIEDLMNIEVTTAARKEQRAADVAAAIFVITRDDIRRSGMTTIPDLLRMVPGVQVAQINSNKWAVSVRGFNGLYTNKLLVLVDGRSIYNRLFSGVLWDAEDPMLDDIERIEVIRGPGAAMWGANAMNGVINIVTRAAADTGGGLVRADAGRFGEQLAVRYGGQLGTARYRVYLQWTGRDQSLIAPDTRANDASHRVTTGFRADWTASPDTVTVEGAVSSGQARALWPNLDRQTASREPLANQSSDASSAHLLGRWTRARGNGSSLQIQSFVDVASRNEPVGDYQRRAVDVDAQYRMPLGARQDLVVGAGYRFVNEALEGGVGFSLTPAHNNLSLASAFVQDEIALFGDRLAVTLGSQVQYDSASGAGVQPTARALWKMGPRQRLWAAASRALRTPSMIDRGVRFDLPSVASASGLPLFVTVLGNPAARSETLVDAEAGYRLEIGTTASIDVTGFMGRYEHLQAGEPSAPLVQLLPSPHISVTSQFASHLSARTRGLEVAGQWAPVPAWRLDGSYSAFRVTPHRWGTRRDLDANVVDGNAPLAQWHIRSAWSAGTRTTIDVALFHASPIEQIDVDAYTRTDTSVEWRFTNRLSIMAIGQNLFDARHEEFATAASLLLATGIPRSVNLRLRWVFR